MKFVIALILAVGVVAINQVSGHGRLMEPPNRSSLWRVPRFESCKPPVNYDDNQLWCGGLHQEEVVGGNCGVCGDPIAQHTPRDNEFGGKLHRAIITRKYQAGQVIDVEVDLTIGHWGYMEFRLCTNPLAGESQECFNRHLLQRADGSGSRIEADLTGKYRAAYRLPARVYCKHCVIQWNYRAANNCGQCEDGSYGPGCGPQETFRGCSDIQIK